MGGDSILELINFVYFEATGRNLTEEDRKQMLEDYMNN